MPKVLNRATQVLGENLVLNSVSMTVIEFGDNGLVRKARGATVPTDASAGFELGAKFIKTDGTALTGVEYINEGSATSCDFNIVTSLSTAGQVQYAEVSLTNAEMLALRAAPKTLVAAPGAGKMLQFLGATLLFDYVGAYTETTDNMAIKYTDGSGVAVSDAIEATGFVNATADTVTFARPAIDGIVAKSGSENKALVLHNTGDGEYGGGNAGNAVRVKVAYRIITTGF